MSETLKKGHFLFQFLPTGVLGKGSVPFFILLLGLVGCVRLTTVDNQNATRESRVDSYLGEFCSSGFPKDGHIYQAIRDVLIRIPDEAFQIVTNRRRPVLFTEFYDSGTARFANTSEIIATEKDIPAFQEGMTIIKLSTGLEEAGSALPIEGIVAHELAHKVLDHVRKGKVSCQSEREANRLVKEWGLTEEYTAASQMFGREKTGGSASCQEEPNSLKSSEEIYPK